MEARTKTSMLDYCKLILKAVQFDARLFRKEYRKSLLRLNQLEAVELKRWVRYQLASAPASSTKNMNANQ
ncbi:MAG: hypothetical protein KatS3mg032_0868 [Cyclobacteriaceae bacterium]|nr:MAG: hypothetical protein KatS3mg032_0868 [Cyclobacteriaceae bacterium]